MYLLNGIASSRSQPQTMLAAALLAFAAVACARVTMEPGQLRAVPAGWIRTHNPLAAASLTIAM